MSLRQRILDAQKQAMKEGDKASLSTLRMVWSALRNIEIDKGGELTDEEVQEVIARQVKQLKDAMTDFEKGGRSDLMEQTQVEIAYLSQYLPQQLTDEELEKVVQNIVSAHSGEKNAGIIMGAVMKEVKGKADGKKVREFVEKILSQGA